jgi:hypothetical protein
MPSFLSNKWTWLSSNAQAKQFIFVSETKTGKRSRNFFPIIIRPEYVSPFDSIDDHMVQRPWGVNPGFPWHGL